mgnify:FL=1
MPPVRPVGREEEGMPRPFRSRRWHIRASDLETHGRTIGCWGCDMSLKGKSGNHTEQCRDRIAIALAGVGDPRVWEDIERIASDYREEPEVHPGPGPPAAIEEEPEAPDPSEGDPDDMSVQSALENQVMMLTADPSKAKEWARWDKRVCAQWQGKKWDDGVHEMEARLDKVDFTTHVSEIYSPPRVTGLAGKMGLDPGMALDLSVVDPDDGKPWDFNDASKRKKALHLSLIHI